MNTVQDIPLDARKGMGGKGAGGLAVVAWGFGRMRPGRIESIGPKNTRVRLVSGADGREYLKPIPHGEVFIVPDAPGDPDAAQVARLLNGAAAWQVNRRMGVDSGRAYQAARAYAEGGAA